MSPWRVEELIFIGVFIAVVWFVWTRIANDLPDDFLPVVRKHLNHKNGGDDGGIRDNR
jgi:hypothetical protein